MTLHKMTLIQVAKALRGSWEETEVFHVRSGEEEGDIWQGRPRNATQHAQTCFTSEPNAAPSRHIGRFAGVRGRGVAVVVIGL
jgi:hypothetical protein